MASSWTGGGLGQLGQVTLFSDSMRVSPWAASRVRSVSALLCTWSSNLANCPGVSGLQPPPGSGHWLYLATPAQLQAQWPRVANASFMKDKKCISINVLYCALSKASCLLSCLHLLHGEAPSATSSPEGSLSSCAPLTQPVLYPNTRAPLPVGPSMPLECSLSW